MVQKNFYKNKYFRSISKKKLEIKKLFVKNDWIAHHGIERSGTNYLRAILIILKINLINQFDPAENHPTHKHFRWYTDKSLIPNLKKSLINDLTANNISDVNKLCKYFPSTNHIIIRKKTISGVTSIANYFYNFKLLQDKKELKNNIHVIYNDYIAYYDFWQKIYEQNPSRVQIIFYEDLIKSSEVLINALNVIGINSNINISKKFNLDEIKESDPYRKKNFSENQILEILSDKLF